MSSLRTVLLGCFCAATLLATPDARPAPPARLMAANPSDLSDAGRDAFVVRVLSRPEVRMLTTGRRTRVLRVWTDVEKTGTGVRRRGTVLLRDYDAGVARELTSDLDGGPVTVSRELVNVPPSEEEIAEAMAIARRDPALERFVRDPNLTLTGGFHNRSRVSGDPCARNVCLDLAFMRPDYAGPARYVIVDLTLQVVAHHDFRGGRGKPARMTETAP